jgi:hypothetical protein
MRCKCHWANGMRRGVQRTKGTIYTQRQNRKGCSPFLDDQSIVLQWWAHSVIVSKQGRCPTPCSKLLRFFPTLGGSLNPNCESMCLQSLKVFKVRSIFSIIVFFKLTWFLVRKWTHEFENCEGWQTRWFVALLLPRIFFLSWSKLMCMTLQISSTRTSGGGYIILHYSRARRN